MIKEIRNISSHTNKDFNKFQEEFTLFDFFKTGGLK